MRVYFHLSFISRLLRFFSSNKSCFIDNAYYCESLSDLVLLLCYSNDEVTTRTVTHADKNWPKMAKSAERLPGTSTRLRTRDDGCCSVNFLKYVLHIYNVVLFVSTDHFYLDISAPRRNNGDIVLFRNVFTSARINERPWNSLFCFTGESVPFSTSRFLRYFD